MPRTAPRIDLTQVAYDAQAQAFRARAILHDGPASVEADLSWHGPITAAYARITAGLAASATR